jgi:hypothetical protein
VVPRLTIGHIYNLQPELVDKVTATILDFGNEGSAAEGGKPMRFMKADYKKDFQFVRSIDDCFDPRFHKLVQADPVPTADENPPQQQ